MRLKGNTVVIGLLSFTIGVYIGRSIHRQTYSGDVQLNVKQATITSFPDAKSNNDKSESADSNKDEKPSVIPISLALRWGTSKTDTKAILDILEALAREDPEAALSEAVKLESAGYKGAVHAALRGWADVDVRASLAWASSKIVGREDPYLGKLSYYCTSKGYFKDVAAAIANRSDDNITRMMAFELATQWGRTSSKEFVSWLGGISASDPMRPGIIAAYISSIAETDIELAKSFALTGTASPSEKAAAVKMIVEGFINTGRLNDALAWFNSMEDSGGRSVAMGPIASALADTDLPQSLELVRKMQAGSDKDSALLRIAAVGYKDQPDAQFKLLEEVSPGAYRIRILEDAVARWAARDKVAASKYVQNSSSLSADERSHLFRRIHG